MVPSLISCLVRTVGQSINRSINRSQSLLQLDAIHIGMVDGRGGSLSEIKNVTGQKEIEIRHNNNFST
jgi:hypothetical protein